MLNELLGIKIDSSFGDEFAVGGDDVGTQLGEEKVGAILQKEQGFQILALLFEENFDLLVLIRLLEFCQSQDLFFESVEAQFFHFEGFFGAAFLQIGLGCFQINQFQRTVEVFLEEGEKTMLLDGLEEQTNFIG